MAMISKALRRLQVGPFGPEGLRLREQLWLTPSADPAITLRSTLFRPAPTRAPFPLAIINHGTPGSAVERMALPTPSFYLLSSWFVDRGFAVLIPQRRGHGATGTYHAESFRYPDGVDFTRAAGHGADDIEAAASYMRSQKFVQPDRVWIVGLSSGGWASLALAARNPPFVRGVINIAGGRGGRVEGLPNNNLEPDRLVTSAASMGRPTRVPSLWLYARNDKHFGPDLAIRLYEAWRAGGAPTEFHLLPAIGRDGHKLATQLGGIQVCAPIIDAFIGKISNRDAPATSGARPGRSGLGIFGQQPTKPPIDEVFGKSLHEGDFGADF